MNSDIRQLLEAVKNGETSVDDALLEIKKAPFEDIGYAKVDLHRKIRQGAAEVIYGAGKTPEQIAGIIDAMLKNGHRETGGRYLFQSTGGDHSPPLLPPIPAP